MVRGGAGGGKGHTSPPWRAPSGYWNPWVGWQPPAPSGAGPGARPATSKAKRPYTVCKCGSWVWGDRKKRFCGVCGEALPEKGNQKQPTGKGKGDVRGDDLPTIAPDKEQLVRDFLAKAKADIGADLEGLFQVQYPATVDVASAKRFNQSRQKVDSLKKHAAKKQNDIKRLEEQMQAAKVSLESAQKDLHEAELELRDSLAGLADEYGAGGAESRPAAAGGGTQAKAEFDKTEGEDEDEEMREAITAEKRARKELEDAHERTQALRRDKHSRTAAPGEQAGLPSVQAGLQAAAAARELAAADDGQQRG